MTLPSLLFGRAGDGVHVDLDRLYESRLLIQGVSGSGKSTVIRSLCEQMYGVVPQLVMDFEGDFVTLREKYDFVLVGKGGDAPIAIKTAKVMLRRLIELNASVIFDLSELKFPERREWVRVACEELVHLPRQLQHTRLVILDEAQVFAPERGQGESVATEAVVDLVTLGRKRGLVPICATQRLSKLHKDVAGNLQNKLIGYTDDVDLQRSGDALGMTKEQRTGLKLLETHSFYAYGPAISRAPVLVRTLMPATKPPPRGQERPPAPPARAAVQKLLSKLVDLPKEAEEEARTVQDLQRKNADLSGRIRQLEKGVATKTVEKPVVDQAAITRAVREATDAGARELRRFKQTIKGEVGRALQQVNRLSVDGQQLATTIAALESAANASFEQPVPRPEPTAPASPAGRKAPSAVSSRPSYAGGSGDPSSLGKGEKIMLIAIAQYPDGALRDQLTVLTGYKRSSRDTYIQRLASAGFVEIRGNSVQATDAGVDALGTDFEPLPHGEELQQYWLNKLPEGERKILDIMIQQFPSAVDRERLSEETGYKRSSRDTYLQRLSSRRLVENVGRGEVRASANLFAGALV